MSLDYGWRVSFSRRVHSADYVWDNLSKLFIVLLWFNDSEFVEYRSFPDGARTRACVDAVNSLNDPWLVDGLVQEGVQ